MAFILKLFDGTNTVDFITVDYTLANGGLEISTPKKKQLWGGNSVYANGAQLVSNTWENRDIKILFHVTGTTPETLKANVSKIERLLEQARTRSIEHVGSRVELQYQWDGASQKTYFEVLDGDLMWPRDVLSVEQVHQRTAIGRYIIREFELNLVCTPFAFPISPVNGALTSAPLTNGNGSNVTNGLAVWNHDDAGAGHDNWVEVDGASIAGDYPAKIVLSMQANSGEVERTSKVYVGVRKGNLAFRQIWEDNAADEVNGGTPTASVDASGGFYTPIPFSGNTEDILIGWQVTPAESTNLQGPFRIFAKCKLGSHWATNANYRMAFAAPATYDEFHYGEWVKPVNSLTELLDLGTVFLPPWLYGISGTLEGFAMTLHVKGDEVGSSGTIDFDELILRPHDAGFRVMEFRIRGMYETEYLVDDGWEDIVYHINSAGSKTGYPFGLMPKIELKPGQDHRFYFLMEGRSKNCDITRQLKIKLYVVPVYNVIV